MKKTKIIIAVLLLVLCFAFAACGPKDYVLNESIFFRVMTNVQYFPEQYIDSTIELDCFTYRLEDADGTVYICGVRKCSAGYGCTCGNDTIIGFVLEYDGEIPEPRNQSADNNDKTWVHLKGKLKSADKLTITLNSFAQGADGSQIPDQIQMLTFVVESCDLIEDASNLNYYVTK